MPVSINFAGVFPAITTPFLENGEIDHAFVEKHVAWQLEAGAHGIVPCGSLGEGATLTFSEKVELVRTCVTTCGEIPVVPGVASLSTEDGIAAIQAYEAAGARGFMVLPPYAYSTDWAEMKAHMKALINATDLPCILYNNPVAYKTDFLPEHIAEIAGECPNLHAVKESSTDIRRLAAIRALIGDRLTLMMGVDDLAVEGIRMGATGWIAGQVNAFPVETMKLWRDTLDGKDVDALYAWFLPLLRLDTVPKFVQLIKLTQQEVGMGSERVRAPRQVLSGREREEALAVIRKGIAERPA